MKNSAKSLLCAALALAGAASLPAQPATKIVVLDLQQIFDEYYETPGQRERIKGFEDELKKDLEKINTDLNDLGKQYQDLVAKVNGDPTITAAAKADAETRARDLLARVQGKQKEGQQLVSTAQERSARSFENYKENAIKTITAAATEVAKQKGATVLIDKSPNTTYRTSTFLWLDPAYEDITDTVLKKLNTGHEAEVAAAKKAAAAAPAGSTLPPLPKAP
jgi:Skp family chaperone for outer membrane proteins